MKQNLLPRGIIKYNKQTSYQSLGPDTMITKKTKHNKHNGIPDSKVHGANKGAHLGPTGPRWAPCWPHGLCYLGYFIWDTVRSFIHTNRHSRLNYHYPYQAQLRDLITMLSNYFYIWDSSFFYQGKTDLQNIETIEKLSKRHTYTIQVQNHRAALVFKICVYLHRFSPSI